MKHFFFTLLFTVACAIGAFAQFDSVLTVKVTGIENDNGYILLALYDNAKDWDKPELAKYLRIEPASKGAMLIEFAHLAPGRYSIAALHDEDDSNDMTFMPFGIPKEAYGFSNNARGLMGAPSFEECIFNFERSKTIHIKVK